MPNGLPFSDSPDRSSGRLDVEADAGSGVGSPCIGESILSRGGRQWLEDDRLKTKNREPSAESLYTLTNGRAGGKVALGLEVVKASRLQACGCQTRKKLIRQCGS
jgi:hypothetical protein